MDNQVIVVVTEPDATRSVNEYLGTATLSTPKPYVHQSGLYMTELHVDQGKSLCLQLPECNLKSTVSAGSKNKHVELLFDRKGNEVVNECLEQIMFLCQQDIFDATYCEAR